MAVFYSSGDEATKPGPHYEGSKAGFLTPAPLRNPQQVGAPGLGAPTPGSPSRFEDLAKEATGGNYTNTPGKGGMAYPGGAVNSGAPGAAGVKAPQDWDPSQWAGGLAGGPKGGPGGPIGGNVRSVDSGVSGRFGNVAQALAGMPTGQPVAQTFNAPSLTPGAAKPSLGAQVAPSYGRPAQTDVFGPQEPLVKKVGKEPGWYDPVTLEPVAPGTPGAVQAETVGTFGLEEGEYLPTPPGETSDFEDNYSIVNPASKGGIRASIFSRGHPSWANLAEWYGNDAPQPKQPYDPKNPQPNIETPDAYQQEIKDLLADIDTSYQDQEAHALSVNEAQKQSAINDMAGILGSRGVGTSLAAMAPGTIDVENQFGQLGADAVAKIRGEQTAAKLQELTTLGQIAADTGNLELQAQVNQAKLEQSAYAQSQDAKAQEQEARQGVMDSIWTDVANMKTALNYDALSPDDRKAFDVAMAMMAEYAQDPNVTADMLQSYFFQLFSQWIGVIEGV